MGVARHQHLLILLALLDEFVEKHLHALCHLHQLMTGEKFQVYKHLVVARTARMNLLTHIAQLARQHKFNLRVDVLDTLLNHELASLANLIDIL